MKSRLTSAFCLFTICLFGQSPYQFDWKKDLGYLGFGTTNVVLGYSIEHDDFPTFDEAEILNLDRRDVNQFDRRATFFYSASAGKTSDLLKEGAYGLPLLFLLNQRMRKDATTVFGLYAETLFMTASVTHMMKRWVKRPRPFIFNEAVPVDKKFGKDARYSFFSGHTSISAASCFFTAKVFSDYFPDSKWKPVVWSTAVVIPAAVAYCRVRGGRHFPTDVIAGYTMGAFLGFIVPHLHKKTSTERFSIAPTPAGFAMVWKFN